MNSAGESLPRLTGSESLGFSTRDMNLVKDSKMSSLILSSTAASVFSHFSKLAIVGMT